MDKILVTGSEGFIGSHLVEKLVQDNYSVKAFVLYNSFNSYGWLDSIDKEIRKNIEIFFGDIRDSYSVKEAMKECNQVINLAALIGIPYSYYAADSYIETNIKGTLNLLQAAKNSNIQKFIQTSTSEVYGTAEFVPITEDHPLKGQSPYSASKIASDQLAFSFHSSFEMPISIIRPFNTYGPRQSARAVIPTIITQLLNDKKILKLGALTPTRDFSYVEDIALGFISALKSDRAIGEFINLGSSFEISIEETAKSIAKILDKEIIIQEDKNRLRPENSEVERLYAATDKAHKLLDWYPNYSGYEGFKNGLKNTIDWFSNQENLKLYKHEIYNK